MSNNVLAARDINTSAPSIQSNLDNKATSTSTADNVKSMDYHRQVLQSRIAEEKYVLPSTNPQSSDSLPRVEANVDLYCRGTQIYVSPSDTIMSPCTAKLSAMKNKRFAR